VQAIIYRFFQKGRVLTPWLEWGWKKRLCMEGRRLHAMNQHTSDCGRLPSLEAIELEVEAAACCATADPAGGNPTPRNPVWPGTNSSWAFSTAKNKQRIRRAGAVETACRQRQGRFTRTGQFWSEAGMKHLCARQDTGKNSGTPTPNHDEKMRPERLVEG